MYRYERSGTMHGLMRVRGFTQDDAHIFCLPSQLQEEIVGVLTLVERILNRFGFRRFDVMLSTRPAASVGSDDLWDAATSALRRALEQKQWAYIEDPGGGAFYGPKIDVKIRDAIGRQWQCSTIQCDFNLPARFELEYAAADGTHQRPVMVHRAIFGSLERFFGVLLENNMGHFPLWLAPEQLRLLPVTDDLIPYCRELQAMARSQHRGLLVEIDESNERLPKKVRNAEMQRVPLLGIVGKREADSGPQLREISVRANKGVDLGVLRAADLFEAMEQAVRDPMGPPSEIFRGEVQ